MGTDIHLQVERQNEDGSWKRVPHIENVCSWCDGEQEYSNGTKCFGCNGSGKRFQPYFDDRNYSLFGILADVRNGFGFGGCDTGDGFVPISEPRGLPDDLSPEIAENIRTDGGAAEYGDPQYFWMGDHSHSWLLLSEILEYDWSRTTKKRGWVGQDGYREWRDEGAPSSWSGFVIGKNVHHISNEEMDARSTSSPVAVHDDDRYVTQVEWPVCYRECADRFLRVVERDLLPLGDPAKTRLVFGFDS